MNADPLDAVVETAERLSALLAAGLTPAAAWAHIADGGGPPLVARAARAAGSGEPVAPALIADVETAPEAARPAWRSLAAGVALAERTGAPLAAVLEQLTLALRDLQSAERDIRAALTGPRLSGRLVLALPGVGVAFGFALGFDPLGVLLGTPLGRVCGSAGAALYLAGWAWTRALVRNARPASDVPGLEAELVAAALAAGLPVGAARRLVGELAELCSIARENGQDIDRSTALAARAGVPVAGLLRSEARHRRRTAAGAARIRAESLAVTLLVPLGVCLLPSFMLLSVAPLLLSIVSATVLPL